MEINSHDYCTTVRAHLRALKDTHQESWIHKATTTREEVTICGRHEKNQVEGGPVSCQEVSSSHHQTVDVNWSARYGRYLVASRDILAGEVLFQEEPLLVLPKVDSDPACLACLKLLKNEWSGCSGCGGPMCLPHCPGNHHSVDECTLLKRLGLRAPPHIDALMKELNILIGPLRLLLLIQESPSARDTILSLESHKDKRQKLAIGNFVHEYIVGGLRSRLGLEVCPDIVHQVCGVLDTNAFDVSLNNEGRGRALCAVASMMNHSCLPNAQRWFCEEKIVVRAAMDIAKSSPILINYTQTLWGSQARNAHLSAFKMFRCSCERCADPTELGSHLSSVCCRDCRDLLVPPAGDKNSWQCQGCGVIVECGAVEAMVRAGAATLTRLCEDDTAAATVTLSHLTRVLGTRHYIVAQAKQALLQAIMKPQPQDLPSEDLKRVAALSQDLLDLTASLEPGLTRLRGLLLYQLVRALTELLSRGESGEGEGESEERKTEEGEGEGESEERRTEEGESEERRTEEGESEERRTEEGEGEGESEEKRTEEGAGGNNQEGVRTQNPPPLAPPPPLLQRVLGQARECENILQYDHLLPKVQLLSTRLHHLASQHPHNHQRNKLGQRNSMENRGQHIISEALRDCL